MNIRKERKNKHIKYARVLPQVGGTGFEQFHLVNNSLPDIKFDDINCESTFLERKISYPIMINAMTGGTLRGYNINKALAELAVSYNIPMAVGSQRIALNDESALESFRIVRRINKDGIVIANLGADASLNDVKNAIDMIEANAIQLHLNVPQEICMNEGDRDFTRVINNIEEISNEINIPVIVKETGFGISPFSAQKLIQAGIQYIDISGYGGTNFVKIENKRRKDQLSYRFLESWGLPTAMSLVECRKVSEDLCIVCSGGIQDGYDIVKSIRLGADIVGICGKFLHLRGFGFQKQCQKYMESLTNQLKVLMLLTGASDVAALKKIPIYTLGDTWRWFEQ